MQNSDLNSIHFALCIGGAYFAIMIPFILYMIFGNPSKEFMETIKDYHPPGHD